MTHYAKGVDKQVVNTRTRNDCRHRPLHRYPGPPRSRQPHANGAGRPAYRRPGLPRSRRPCADGAGRPTCGRGWTAHMMEEQMGETDGAAAAWDAEYRAGPRAHPGGPGAGSRRRPVLRAGQRDGDGYLARARGDGASPPNGTCLFTSSAPPSWGLCLVRVSSQSCSSDRNTPGALRPSPAGGPSGKPSGGG